MGTFNASIKGLDEVIAKLDVNKFRDDIQNAFDAFGQSVVTSAKLKAPVDEGGLKNSINATPGNLSITIGVNKDYAAYVEFGTRKFAASYVSSLPTDWKTFAAQFKGKTGGSFMSFFYVILKWVQRKGIAAHKTKSGGRSNSKASIQAEYSAAYFIALKIIREGIKPHPFLYPAFNEHQPQLIKDLENLLQ